MKNVILSVKDGILTAQIDLAENFGRSASGKTEIVATTAGNADVPQTPGFKIGLNVYKYPER